LARKENKEYRAKLVNKVLLVKMEKHLEFLAHKENKGKQEQPDPPVKMEQTAQMALTGLMEPMVKMARMAMPT
jgi:hypothetical protein